MGLFGQLSRNIDFTGNMALWVNLNKGMLPDTLFHGQFVVRLYRRPKKFRYEGAFVQVYRFGLLIHEIIGIGHIVQ